VVKIIEEVLLTKDGKTKVVRVKTQVRVPPSYPVRRMFEVVGRNGAKYFLGQSHDNLKKWMLGRETKSGVRRISYTNVRFRKRKNKKNKR